MHWTRQAYLTMIPAYPMGYLLINGFRGDQPWTKLYVERSNVEANSLLKDLVESELDHVHTSKAVKTLVTITDELEPKVYGALFLNPGAELQFPLRVSFEDVEQARRLSANIELDLGLQKYRKKIETRTQIGDELISRMMLSDVAKKFIIQRQLQIANSGQFFCMPILSWVGITTACYGIVLGVSGVAGPIVGMISGLGVSVLSFYQFIKGYNGYITKKADEMTIDLGEEYEKGAQDYLTSTMKYTRLLRRVLGEEGERNISTGGDIRFENPTYSERLRNIDLHIRQRKLKN
ncbi:unnamed protein product [Auanema sp. JU1783]|nr:unnamed protein product [Auanema sp. JU1783]